MKICRTCGNNLSTDSFKKTHLKKDGTQSYSLDCKKCLREIAKKYRIDNKDKIAIYESKRKNSMERKEYKEKYRKENNDSLKAYSKKYNTEKKENMKYMINDLFQEDVKKITYIIKSDGFYKIGQSTSLYTRLVKLNTYIQINNIYVLNKNIESRLLREFKQFKTDPCIEFGGKYECFNFTTDILNYIIKKEGFIEIKGCNNILNVV